MHQIVKAGVLARLAVAIALGDAHAADKPAPPPDPGEQIKDGATQFGQGIKQGAINLWEATKAAVSTGVDKLSSHPAPPPVKTAPAAPPQK
jgi:hypothetical protein